MDWTAKKDYLLPHEKLGTYFVEKHACNHAVEPVFLQLVLAR